MIFIAVFEKVRRTAINRRIFTEEYSSIVKQKFLSDILDSHPENGPALGFLSADHKETWFNWGEFRTRALAIAAWLQKEVEAKAPVILLFEPSTDFIVSYMACIYSGNPAVPVPVPKTLAQGQPPENLVRIIGSCGAKGLLTSDMIAPALPLINGYLAKLGLSIKSVTAREAATMPADSFKRFQLLETDIAMIQHTSGSTANPTGVLLNHRQMSYMSQTMQNVVGLTKDSRGVIWLPHTHNTGLLSTLSGIWCEFPILCMSPITFVTKPVVWLETIAKFKATVSGAPVFAYDLCVRKCRH